MYVYFLTSDSYYIDIFTFHKNQLRHQTSHDLLPSLILVPKNTWLENIQVINGAHAPSEATRTLAEVDKFPPACPVG